jgi:uncharacterized phage protein gp47/JayE
VSSPANPQPEPALPQTPLPVDNPPGQSLLRTRIGTFGSFRRTLLERIANRPELAGLTTRDPDDHSIALLEQWAALADVLTFYSERYANEAYLGTATLDPSLRRLVGLIGYRSRPGVAATTTLAFTLAAGTALEIPVGFSVQSVPGPGEQPQTFGTLEPCAADWRFNSLPVYGQWTPVAPLKNSKGAYLDPTFNDQWLDRLRPGDALLLVSEGGELSTGDPGTVVRTTITTVDATPLGLHLNLAAEAESDQACAYKPRRNLLLNGRDAPNALPPQPSVDDNGNVTGWKYGTAADLSIPAGDSLPLDSTYQDLAIGTWLLVVCANLFTQVVKVLSVSLCTEQLLGPSGPTTQAAFVEVGPMLPDVSDRRQLQVVELVGSGPQAPQVPFVVYNFDPTLPIGNELRIPAQAVGWDVNGPMRVIGPPGGDPAQAPVIAPPDLARGRRLILADAAGQVVATTVLGPVRRELVVDALPTGFLVVPISADPSDVARLDPTTTRLLGNAAAASHGAAVPVEVLGSGDATAAFQRFPLAKSPLTRVPAATPEGSVAALTVEVDQIAWAEVPRLLDAGPKDEVYALRTEADGTTTVQFGDGVTGARPRSGSANVVARYRYGAGLAGRVAAGRLTQALTRLPGLETVDNPAAAQGGADPQDATDLRDRAPGSVRALNRAVSAVDCADLLIATGQVAKASSASVWDGRGLLVTVTVAAPAGGMFGADGRRVLAGVVSSASPPYRRTLVQNYAPVPVLVAAEVTPDPQADADAVIAGVRAALAARLAFANTTLAGPLHLSDLYLAVSGVPGAVSVNLTRLQFRRPDGMPDGVWADFLTAHGASDAPLAERLRLLGVRAAPDSGVLCAELPTLADADLSVTLAAAIPAPASGGFE